MDEKARSEKASEQNPLDEFSLIETFFHDRSFYKDGWASQGIGDDCAFLDVGGGLRLAVTTDMMALSTHFLDDADPYTVGRKALAVNLSDLAAAGSKPRAFFLSIALPKVDQIWLKGFSKGLLEEAQRYNCPLRGGDTVKAASVAGHDGKTVINICAIGELPSAHGLTRAGAKVSDDIWVSGTPGDAMAALGTIWKMWQCGSDEQFKYFKFRMDLPTPRVELGEALLPIATACCDISDGLVGDLGHILERSQVSGELFWDLMPQSAAMKEMDRAVQERCILNGGDDYELLFTAPQSERQNIEALSKQLNVRLTRIGKICDKNVPFKVSDSTGNALKISSSFNHFG